MKKIIYADNAATTRLKRDVQKEMFNYLEKEYGNPSQPYSFSRASRHALKSARKEIANLINANEDEIFFTSGGTESDNWAIKGTAFASSMLKNTIVTSCIEHHAVLKSCEFLENKGYSVVYLPVNPMGLVTSDTLTRMVSKNTCLVSVMMVNNEIGTIQNVKELAALAHAKGSLFHTDAVQAIGHIPVDVKDLNVDMLSASAHKFGGPSGIGFLYIKKGTCIAPMMNGGQQEHGLRAGTENVASIVGMAVALKESIANMGNNIKIAELEKKIISTLQSNGLIVGKDFVVNGDGDNKMPGILSISFNEKDGESILHRMDLMGIMISTGAACDSVHTRISHVIRAIGVAKNFAKGTIRISLGLDNTLEEATLIGEALVKIIEKKGD